MRRRAYVGVRVSALRFWERPGPLQPTREIGSKYRLYDERQSGHLRVVALLRRANHDFATIRAALDALEAGQPQGAAVAVARRRDALADMSWRCLGAAAAFDAYVRAFVERP